MTDKKKQEFTLRITQANKSETVVILYDMFQTCLEDANLAAVKNAERSSVSSNPREAMDGAEFHRAIRQARAVLNELIESLFMEYDIAQNLYQIYRYVERLLIRADVRLEVSPLKEAGRLMGKLGHAYELVSKEDTSPAIMENAESVYAGMTYGKTELHESNIGSSANRGFLA